MHSLFSAEISRLFHSIFEPARKEGLRALITEREGYLQMVLFRDNFNSFTGEDRLRFAMMIKEFMEKVRGMGVPIYMQVAKGDGRDA